MPKPTREGRAPKVGLGLDPELRRFATARDVEILDAIEKAGGVKKAAALLGVAHQNVYRAVKNLQARAAKYGYSPEADARGEAPEGFRLRGKSTYYDRDGKIRGQWVKTQVDADQREAALLALAEGLSATLPRAERGDPAPGSLPRSLLTLISFFDFHFGMRAWARETGGDWDLAIAARIFDRALASFFDRTPPAATCLLNFGGDFWHYDSMQPVTNRSGHVLDADSRKHKMIQIAAVAIRRAVSQAKLRFERVILLVEEGNHDEETAVTHQVLLAALYENDPQVEVIVSPLPYYALRHGKMMLCFHHGHLKKIDQLPLLFAALFREMWGQTRVAHIHTGHFHHAYEKEHPGATVTQHPTLAAPDSHAARHGYVSERAAIAHTYHEDGRLECCTYVSPSMLEQAA
jgi:hypothetical protein